MYQYRGTTKDYSVTSGQIRVQHVDDLADFVAKRWERGWRQLSIMDESCQAVASIYWADGKRRWWWHWRSEEAFGEEV